MSENLPVSGKLLGWVTTKFPELSLEQAKSMTSELEEQYRDGLERGGQLAFKFVDDQGNITWEVIEIGYFDDFKNIL